MPTIAEIKGTCTTDKQWVSGEITVTVSNTQDSSGKGPSSCTLTDATGTISGKLWGRAASQYNGCKVKIGGKGISASEYKQVPEINIGDKATISILGDAPRASSPSQSATTQGRGVSEQSRSSVEVKTVDERAVDWFRVHEAVLKHASKEGFTPEMLKDVTTTLYLSYKEGYVWNDPLFEKVVAADWRAVKTASGKALGEMSDPELASLTLKIVGLGAKAHEEPKTKAGLDAVLAAVKEKGWEPVKVAELAFELLPGGGTEFYVNELYSVARKDSGAESELELTLPQWASVFSDLKKLEAACRAEMEQDPGIPF